ncbi:hypothetical protein RSW40_26795, partial [Escherichia coli]|nr:hypothetical protein [Escherichia coli]
MRVPAEFGSLAAPRGNFADVGQSHLKCRVVRLTLTLAMQTQRFGQVLGQGGPGVVVPASITAPLGTAEVAFQFKG